MDEIQQIDKIRQGNEQAFEAVFKEYYFYLTRFAWRYVESKAIAEEVVQELFTEIWERRENFVITGSLRSYLYKAVKHKSLNYIKHQKIEQKYNPLWMEKKEHPTIQYKDEMREEQIKQAIEAAIEELPERSKMTYKLHRYDGLTYREIAEVMDVSVKTVESQMTRTLKILRERLAYLLPFLLVATLM